jgi:hypothetical protein
MSATPPAAIPSQVALQVDWSGTDELPIMACNVFLVQQTPHEFILTFGVAAPPIIQQPLTPDEAEGMKITPQPILRLALSPGRAVELMQVLQQQIIAYQQTQRH